MHMDGNVNPVLNFLGFNFSPLCHEKPKPNKSSGLFSIFANCFLGRTWVCYPVSKSCGVRGWCWNREGENEQLEFQAFTSVLPSSRCSFFRFIHCIYIRLNGKRGMQLGNIYKLWVQMFSKTLLDLNLDENNRSLDLIKLHPELKNIMAQGEGSGR